jgi:hypothetical protein
MTKSASKDAREPPTRMSALAPRVALDASDQYNAPALENFPLNKYVDSNSLET